jgi:argininosuccinate synthase
VSESNVREHIVLAYTGGLDTSAALVWLRQRGASVVTVTLDVGQGGDLEDLRGRALALGALRAHVVDARDEFARDCVLPALQSGVFHDALTPISRIAHPLVARKLVEIAAIEQATAVSHGGGRTDHTSIEAAVHVLNPRLKVIPAMLDAGFEHAALEAFAQQQGIPMSHGAPRGKARPAGRDLDVPAHVEVRFEDGVPVSVNGVPMPLIELIESVATIAGNHGIGRDIVAEVNTAYGVPAAVVLSEAHEALMGGVQGRATGVARVRLFKGEHTVVGHTPVAVS